MILQSRRVWIAGQWIPAQLEIGKGRIQRILPWGQEPVQEDYGSLRIVPGLAGAALRLREVYGEIICDGCHVHLAAVNHFFAAKGPDYAIMVRDSLQAKYGQPGESYQLGGQDIEIRRDGTARLKGTDTIAGSTLKMNQGLRILVEEGMVPFESALNACTINPARCLGVDQRKGKLCAGYDADLVVLDQDYTVIQTWCRGIKMLSVCENTCNCERSVL